MTGGEPASLLMLGGSDIQVHAIVRAIEMGVTVITCDDRPSNPGHALASASYDVSTTDAEAVLALARDLEVDGILAYASDPAALSAAFAADQLGLPGDPLPAVRSAQDKLLLRAAQRAAGLPVPDFADGADADALGRLRSTSPGSWVVKPVDSSGSKGVIILPRQIVEQEAPSGQRAPFASALARAHAASRAGRVIVESFWGSVGRPLGADVLVVDGTVQHAAFYDQFVTQEATGVGPIGALAPSSAPRPRLDEARRQTQALVAELGLRSGVYNLEFRTDEAGVTCIIDLGARIGGNMLGSVHRLASGIDLVSASIDLALGRPTDVHCSPGVQQHAGYFIVHGRTDGRLRNIARTSGLEALTAEEIISARSGDRVRPYRTSADRLGVLVLAGPDRSALEEVLAQPEAFLQVEVDPCVGLSIDHEIDRARIAQEKGR